MPGIIEEMKKIRHSSFESVSVPHEDIDVKKDNYLRSLSYKVGRKVQEISKKIATKR